MSDNHAQHNTSWTMQTLLLGLATTITIIIAGAIPAEACSVVGLMTIGCRAGQVCVRGQCACAPAFRNCDGQQRNGCETNILMNPFHCGQCGRRCGVAALCIRGQCVCLQPFRLAPIRTYCSDSQSCKVLSSDNLNCGACGKRCPLGSSCRGGQCKCQATGMTACPGGCFNLQTNTQMCGSCSKSCPAASNLANVASVTCSTGKCKITCNGGFNDCDGQISNGCEVSSTSCFFMLSHSK